MGHKNEYETDEWNVLTDVRFELNLHPLRTRFVVRFELDFTSVPNSIQPFRARFEICFELG